MSDDVDSWTIGRLLTWTTEYLKKHGSESPRLDAEVLLAHVRGCARILLYTAFDEPADEKTRTAFRELVRRRAEGAPVAYLVGRREFYSLSFRVTPHVLIPRPETEHVVVTLLDRAKARGGEAIQIADVGTGSGILAICAAKYLPSATVTAIDISEAALAVARANAEEHKVADRIRLVPSNLFDGVPPGETFDFIVSNPPYVSEAEFANLAPDVRQHEPRQALVAGRRGTEVIERLVPAAAERLNPGGWLIMEISPMIHAATEKLIAANGRFDSGPVVKDIAGHARVVQAQRKAADG
jgi:release factor glutamine methyltransferase